MADQVGAVDLPASGVQLKLFPATVGRIVHYTSYDTEHEQKACRAALVTTDADDAGRVGLCVYHPTGHEYLAAVEPQHIDEATTVEAGVSGRQPGTWHWPERV